MDIMNEEDEQNRVDIDRDTIPSEVDLEELIIHCIDAGLDIEDYL